ncbi:MAG: IPT/TIG domain-containing protein [Bacteroidota bacterium]
MNFSEWSRMKITRLCILAVVLIAYACEDHEVAKRSYPVVDTHAVTEVDENGATLNGTILDLGDAGVSDHGFVYDDLPNPSLGDADKLSLGPAMQKGPFSARANRNLIKNKRYFVRSYLIAKGDSTIVYGQTVDFISQGSNAPTIKDFFPKQGLVGDTIVMVGSAFSNVTTNQTIRIGGQVAPIIRATPDTIWFAIPERAQAGENEILLTLGLYNVRPEQKFYLLPMSITGFSPKEVSFGDTITISGSNFPLVPELYRVNVLGKDGTLVKVSSNQMRVAISDEVVESESAITVSLGAQNVESSEKIKLLAPVVTNFSPNKGTANTEIEINGKNFSPIPENNLTKIGDTDLVVLSVDETGLRVQIPSGITPGTYNLALTVAGQTVVISTNFEIIKPIITNITPLTGTWGDLITITGENFSSTASENIVRFGNVQASVVSATPNEIVAAVPNALLTKESQISVQVTSIDNHTGTGNIPFVLLPPQIVSFPSEGKITTLITISGNNFNPVPSNQIVKFGNKEAKVVSASTTQLTVEVPSGVEDSDVYIQVDVAEQSVTSGITFHLISPWRRLNDFPESKAYASSFAVGGHGYVTSGTHPSLTFSKPSWKYDPDAASWASVQAFQYPGGGTPANALLYQISFALGDYGFVGLGVDAYNGDFQEKLLRYSPADDAWYAAADFPGQLGARGVSFAVNDRGYVTTGSGANSSKISETWEYRHDQDSWTRKADFPGPGRHDAAAFAIGNKGYVVAGRNTSDSFYDDLWIYNAPTDTWIQGPSLPGEARALATAFSVGGAGYVIGGLRQNFLPNGLLNDVWRYDPQSNTWTSLGDFPGVPRVNAIAFVIDNKAYYGTGYNAGSNYLEDFWEFDPSKLPD